ncbi:MAG TPA: hypothetical protein VMI12_09100 [Puia sp.]|nr:hypothetical protein [Puia sp.]
MNRNSNFLSSYSGTFFIGRTIIVTVDHSEFAVDHSHRAVDHPHPTSEELHLLTMITFAFLLIYER